MKKLLTTALILCLSAHLFAQESDEEKKFHLGILFVPKLSWASPDSKNIVAGGVKPGVSMGLSFDYHFAKNYSFAVELHHFSGGYKVEAKNISYKSIRTVNNTITYSERAFQIPVSIKLRTGEIGYWKYFGQIGISPTINYRKIKADYSDPTTFGTNPEDSKDRFVNDGKNDFDYSDANVVSDSERPYFLEEDNVAGLRVPLMISAGAEWNLSGQTSIIMGLRYEYAILNAMKAENTVARVSSFGILAGIRF